MFTDQASGTLDARPQLERALDHLRPGDTLVIWKLDRLGRSLRHCSTPSRISKAAASACAVSGETIDTTTPAGRLIFRLFGALAEFERDLIRERTHAGLEAARAHGRRPLLTDHKLSVARQLLDAREQHGRRGRPDRRRQPRDALPQPQGASAGRKPLTRATPALPQVTPTRAPGLVHVSDLASLAFIAALLGGGIVASLAADRLEPSLAAEEATRRPPRCPPALTPAPATARQTPRVRGGDAIERRSFSHPSGPSCISPSRAPSGRTSRSSSLNVASTRMKAMRATASERLAHA
jgi:hypothetical protein